MKKIKDFNKIEQYYCSKCKRIHKKIYRNKLSNTFLNHKQFAYSISIFESFKLDFKRKWNQFKDSIDYQEHLIKRG